MGCGEYTALRLNVFSTVTRESHDVRLAKKRGSARLKGIPGFVLEQPAKTGTKTPEMGANMSNSVPMARLGPLVLALHRAERFGGN